MHARRVLKAGAVGYLTKRSAASDRRDRQVERGRLISSRPLRSNRAAALSGRAVVLAKRVQGVPGAGQGKSVAEIAEVMSLPAPWAHIFIISNKLGASNSAELAIMAIRAGFG